MTVHLVLQGQLQWAFLKTVHCKMFMTTSVKTRHC